MGAQSTIALRVVAVAASLFVAGACSDDDNSGGGSAGSAGDHAGATSAGTSNVAGAPGAAGEAPSGGSASAGSHSGSGGAGGGGDVPGDVATFWTDFATAVCHRYWHCASHDDTSEVRVRLKAEAKDEARCVAKVEEMILARPRVQALNHAVTTGALKFQAGQVQNCLKMAAVCEYPSEMDPVSGAVRLEDVVSCREVFEGNVASDGDCDLSEQCQGDAVCEAKAGGACTGVCTPLLAVGAACTVDRECSSTATTWPICASHKCTQRAIGSPAPIGKSCSTSSTYPLCGDDQWCPTTICVPPIELGGDCDPDTLALSQCQDGYCSASKKCTAFGVVSKAGDACDSAGKTALCDSFSSLTCVAGKCEKWDAASGVPCASTYWFAQALCPRKALLGTGKTCTTGDDCESGLCRGACAASLCGSP
jgi:hypothetical protein